MDGINRATDLCSFFTRSCGTLAVHVADGRGNFLRLQMAYRLARPKTKLTSQVRSHTRLFLRLAGHGCGKFPDSPAPKLAGFSVRGRTVEGRASARPGRAEARPFIGRSNNKDFSRSGAVVCCCALRAAVAISRLDWNDRHDSHPAFRAVPASRDRMAQGGSECGTDHECAVAFENNQRILGTPLEFGI